MYSEKWSSPICRSQLTFTSSTSNLPNFAQVKPRQIASPSDVELVDLWDVAGPLRSGCEGMWWEKVHQRSRVFTKKWRCYQQTLGILPIRMGNTHQLCTYHSWGWLSSCAPSFTGVGQTRRRKLSKNIYQLAHTIKGLKQWKKIFDQHKLKILKMPEKQIWNLSKLLIQKLKGRLEPLPTPSRRVSSCFKIIKLRLEGD